MTTPETVTTPLSEQHQQHQQVDPRTAATRQKVVDIIDHQFDLEILLRHAEGASIAQELAKAERMLEDLRHAILSERQGAPFGNSTISRTLGNPNVQHNPYASQRQSSRRATAYYGRDLRQPEALYAVRADGQFVRLGCPRCERYDFGSIQGLVNHMRLSHKQVFKNTEEGVRFCGIVVPSSEVPLDHPCRTKVVFSSLGVGDGQHGQQDFPKPTIKTYDEDVDLESEDGRARNKRSATDFPQPPRKNSAASINSSSNAGTEDESDTSGGASGGENGLGAGKRRRSSLALSLARPQKGKLGSRPANDSDSDGSDEESGTEVPQRPTAGKGPMRKYGSVSQGASPVIINEGQSARTPAISTSGLASSIRPGSAATFTMPDSRMSSAASSRANSPSLHPLMSENDVSGPSSPISGLPTAIESRTTSGIQSASARRTPGENITIPAAPTTLASVSVTPRPVQVAPAPTSQPPQPSQPPPLPQQHQMQPPIISFGANAIQGGVPAPLDTVGSRFYVKRRVVVGNVSKYLPEEKRDPRLREFPYKWMIYVDGTPKPEDITAYIAKVEFHLHESYKPNHIVTVSEAPFHLSRYAWGETQIKVRLFFHDERNKPVEVYHRLALDPTHCGRQVHGRERHVDLELDRNTKFLAAVPFPTRFKRSGARNNLILNSAAEVAMADGADEDEQELQNTLSGPGAGRSGAAGDSGSRAQSGGSAIVDTVRAASIDEGLTRRTKAKETTLFYCKACGSLWKQHRDGALGVAGTASEPVLLNEETGQRIPNCPHHPRYHAVKEMNEEDRLWLSLLTGRSKNKFALDMLKNCGIVDATGRPISALDRMNMEMQQPFDSAMDLDIGDSEWPQPDSINVGTDVDPNSTLALTPAQRTKAEQLTEAFQKMEVYKCRRSEIDWVLSVMDELKLKTLSLDGGAGAGTGGSRSGLRERDQEQERLLNTPGQDRVPESMTQRAVVGGLLVQATKAFLGSILSKAVKIHRAETEAEKGPESIMMELDSLNASEDEVEVEKAGGSGSNGKKVSDKLLVPHHLYQAIQANPEELDFLTSQYEDMEGMGEMMVGL
ncbi:YEATS domain-containing protein 2 [Linnemannia schmuckeri]|uniref:YEATS domain-containing protein 2 n=1 Tax=Linnemannia schmuckeri TaxID=64567 RepID=A0A9P5S3A2_9FUNG|nr:YEATS domain-containing protein 2 [Linnemannia schmuckeri]